MNERDLRYFAAIAECGSLRRASEQLHISQPALTKCIGRLEEQLDARLFERRGRQIVLTPVGNVLVRRARNIIQSIDETQREVGDYAKGRIGHMRIGAAATLTEFLLPDALSELVELTPEVTMSLTIGMSDVLREALCQGDLDLVIGPAAESEEFDCQPIVKDQVVIVASRLHPLANQVGKLERLRDYRWVLPGLNVETRVWLEQTFKQLGLPAPRLQIEANSLALLPRLIAKTQLLSFISRRNLAKGEIGEQLVEIPFNETTMHRHFGLLTRHDSYISPACHSFMALLAKRSAAIFRG
ncbi:hypothetical protein A8C75_19570 [Marinobacterium aestuarii]|uniref:HTH lysR-type domain-containing protein n=1 Tax=Marinobacterium aestuarii TaxID=1821621 RepID=A0A1A9F2Q9_9GAMM|nr:LysR family transcriptional regulator [Marinobacterium aestuarii]ANG64455.1 hypothetical protein A8C75_19570 [Marinobacterium aestuarii]